MKASETDPSRLLFENRLIEAETICRERLHRNPNDLAALEVHADALLCLENYSEALKEFRRANEMESQQGPPGTQFFLEKIGGLLWLLRREGEALNCFKTAVDGILDGSIQFGDLAGGMSHGLLLWYAGISLPDRGAADYAHNFLLRLGKRSKAQYWPVAIGHFILGRKTHDEVLAAACETPVTLEQAVAKAKNDLLTRRQMVQALFYFGAKERAEGREEECQKWMSMCASLENPIIEIEWFLAKGELDRASRQKI